MAVKGILSIIKNEILNLLSILFFVLFLEIAFPLFIKHYTSFYNLFYSNSILLNLSGGLHILNIILMVGLLVIFFTIIFLLSGFISPGTRKGGLAISIVVVYTTLLLYVDRLTNTFYSYNPYYFTLALLVLIIIIFLSSIIADFFNSFIFNELNKKRYRKYEEAMIIRGTNQMGIEYGVKKEDFFAVHFIGTSGSGKTTFLAYFLNFISEIAKNEGYYFDIKEGFSFIENIHHSIIIDEKFPAKSSNNEGDRVVIELTRKNNKFLKDITLVDWPGNFIEGGKGFSKPQIAYGKGYAIFLDRQIYDNTYSYDLHIFNIINKILTGRKVNLPKPYFIFILFNLNDIMDSSKTQSAKSIVFQLPKTSELIQKKLINHSIFLKAFTNMKTDSEGNIFPENTEIEGMLKIPYDSKVNECFRIFFNWIQSL
jgi:hypothetical protein